MARRATELRSVASVLWQVRHAAVVLRISHSDVFEPTFPSRLVIAVASPNARLADVVDVLRLGAPSH